ncbi:MAG: twin-arginine translocase TatA/TatE family subunit [Bifidobacteriaceae bacterium]|jgi:sec-independent protein translocase protein TatA|nr:twin-arginine translocase TatA/TatE family subunit [Bifidobacteriaceae bacterium]
MRPWHIVVLVVVLLLVFGANKLPDLAKSIGQSLKVFKKEVRELNEEPPAAPPPAAGPGAVPPAEAPSGSAPATEDPPGT